MLVSTVLSKINLEMVAHAKSISAWLVMLAGN